MSPVMIFRKIINQNHHHLILVAWSSHPLMNLLQTYTCEHADMKVVPLGYYVHCQRTVIVAYPWKERGKEWGSGGGREGMIKVRKKERGSALYKPRTQLMLHIHILESNLPANHLKGLMQRMYVGDKRKINAENKTSS